MHSKSRSLLCRPFTISSSCTSSNFFKFTDTLSHSCSPTRSLYNQSDMETLISTFQSGKNSGNETSTNPFQISHGLVDKLLYRFKDDWRSAMAVFRWAGSRSGYVYKPESFDMIVDILGKAKQMGKIRDLLEELRHDHVILLSTIAKVMRRFAGAGQWEDAVRIFDELGSFGLEKNTESMNLLLDTLCKENKVEQARAVFLELKSHISPNAHTFNIFIHGWCKVNRVDEAHWTLQEMKGHGCRPCVISYSTIVQFYCRQGSFYKVYELFDEMHAQGCPPNVVTYTTLLCSLANANEFEEALQVVERMKSVGVKPDALFYNALIHALGRAGRVKDAVQVFEDQMPRNGVTPNTSTYNSMIAMFCHHGQEDRAFSLLNQIESSKLCEPDVQTFYPLLKLCIKTGRTDTCLRKLLDDMVNKHHLSLDISAYKLLIHGLCRAEKCEWAYVLFEEMLGKDITPRYATCRVLLDEVKQKNMHGAASKIEDCMKNL